MNASLEQLNGTDNVDEIQSLLSKVTIDESKRADDQAFDSAALQEKMKKLCLVLSHDATKFTLACKPPRKPQEGLRMLQEFTNTMLRLIGFFYDIPAEASSDLIAYRKAYKSLVDKLLRNSVSLLSTFLDDDHRLDTGSSASFMLPTAAFWEVCKSSPAKLPKDNQQAVAFEWNDLLEILADAKKEAEEMGQSTDKDSGVISDGDEDSDFDIEVDPSVAKRCVLFASLTRMLFQKIQKRCRLSDQLLKQGTIVTEETDVLISKAYDMEPSEMKQVMEHYITAVRKLIDVGQLASDEENKEWFTMCYAKYDEILVKSFEP
ncbi:hypothetical protein DM01DRAFT_1337357 [Hesseltinella vesiculosa]|uniref:Cyclin-D1-binding protein 1-like N-terminal domain-containing protein n=1 Tax=Hesseltinella vesiculosa TaxID=101127 RepID=A0A1X2GDM7_9FUNG|nr:hypothetical protein DM01DRAFT_1337357 [Hesseltinella vesiculosa]